MGTYIIFIVSHGAGAGRGRAKAAEAQTMYGWCIENNKLGLTGFGCKILCINILVLH